MYHSLFGLLDQKEYGKDVSNEAVELSGHEETEISLITNDATIKLLLDCMYTIRLKIVFERVLL